MTTEPAGNNPDHVHLNKAIDYLSGRTCLGPRVMEEGFLSALMGKEVTEIGRYSVYCDYRENETVVFIHDPTGQSDHKYIFAETADHAFIVAAPMAWTKYHREILARVCAATGKSARCPGGGYVSVSRDGSLIVDSSSGDFGRGDHARAKAAFEDAIRITGERQGSH